MAYLYFQVFLLGFLLKVAPKCRGNQIVAGFKEEDVALSCLNFNLTDPTTCYRFRLISLTDASKRVLFEHPKEVLDVTRVKLQANEKGQTCVLLKTLQKSDEGRYSLEIWKGWDTIKVTTISLKVKDCRALKPQIAKVNQTVNLTCLVDAETAPSNVKWSKLKGSSSAPVDSKTVELAEVLMITSVSISDSGWYMCNYTLRQTKGCLTINLDVNGHQDKSEDVFATTMVPSPAFTEAQHDSSQGLETNKTDKSKTSILVVVLVTTLVITLAILTGVFIYKRYKTKRIAACFTQALELHENVNLPYSPDVTSRINSFYGFPEESVESCTFQI